MEVGSQNLSQLEINRIYTQPQSKDELFSVINESEKLWKGLMEKWKPVADVVEEQNNLVSDFLKEKNDALKIQERGSSKEIGYTVIANFRGEEKKIYSRQNWIEDSSGILRLNSLWEQEFVDILDLHVANWESKTVEVEGEEVKHVRYKHPAGYLTASSAGMGKVVKWKGNHDYVYDSYDLVLPVVKYYSEYIAKLLKRPDARVEQK